MDLGFSADELAFRDEVRAFIAEHLPPRRQDEFARTTSVFPEPDVNRAWHRALYDKGWAAPGWPREYGGPGWTPAQRYLFEAECARAGTPTITPMGIRMVGPVIIGFGTPEQKAFYLPRMLSGDDYWCQGYSEPGSGSDLASLKTRAVRDGDHYVIDGTKIWTTHAHHANRMFALVRTDDSGRKQDGITFMLIDMDTPGITVRPIRTIGGEHEFNQVFFDDVRVPVANRVGDEGRGWTYGKYLLEFERGGGLAAARMRRELAKVEAAAAGPALSAPSRRLDDPRVQAQIIEIENDIDALEMTELRVISSLQTGQNPGAISSMLKLRASEIKQSITRLGVELIGAQALVWESRRPLYDDAVAASTSRIASPAVMPVTSSYLNSRAHTIFGGSSEIQRDIMAKTMLGL
ncbi:MAG: acyl-CoA dehydrogenase family protein [Burkholderiaceae bacterium]